MESLKLTTVKVTHLERDLESLSIGQLETDLEWLRLRATDLQRQGDDQEDRDDAGRVLERIRTLMSDMEAELLAQRGRVERANQELVDPELDGDLD